MKFRNSGFILAFQLLSTLLQVVYGAFTSRFVVDLEFGYYATSLILLALFTLIFGSGFTEEAIFTKSASNNRFAANLSQSLSSSIFGLVSTITLGGLTLWALNVPMILMLPIATLVILVSIQNTILGVYSRLAKFKAVSIVTFVCNALGFFTASIFVYLSPTAFSLMISPVISSVLFVAVGLSIFRKEFFPTPPLSKKHLVFPSANKKFIVYRSLWFLNSNASRWGLIFLGGQSILGNLNRAEVVTSVPLQQIQAAVNKPFYVVASRERNSFATQSLVFSKSFGSFMVLWVSLIAMATPVISDLSVILLGEGWPEASKVTPWLLVIGAVQLPTVLLSTVIETQSLLKKTYAIEIFILVSQCVALLFITQNTILTFVAIVMLLSMTFRFFGYLGVLICLKLIPLPSITRWIFYAMVSGLIWFSTHMLLKWIFSFFLGWSSFAVPTILCLIAFYIFALKTRTGRTLVDHMSRLVNLD